MICEFSTYWPSIIAVYSGNSDHGFEMCTAQIYSVYLPFSWERKSFRIDVVTTGTMSTFSVINTNSRSINNSINLDAKKRVSNNTINQLRVP
jgi:hypothetical protein